jgi:hypothetical protein
MTFLNFIKWLLTPFIVKAAPEAQNAPISTLPQTPQPPAPTLATAPSSPQIAPNPDTLAPDWATQQHNYHNVRVLCDLAGLTVDEKNVICACVYQESNFFNYEANGQPMRHLNTSADGTLLSTDWGIAQINDYWHVTKYPDFPSSAFIMANPQKAIQFMIDAYKGGGLNQWVSFSTGAYKQWLLPTSPMWDL